MICFTKNLNLKKKENKKNIFFFGGGGGCGMGLELVDFFFTMNPNL